MEKHAKQPRIRVCVDLKVHEQKKADPKPRIELNRDRCDGNVCALTEWKPRKQDAA